MLAGLALAGTPAVQAQGFQDVSLSWVRVRGAQGCIGAHALAHEVEKRIGHPIWVATGDAELSVEGYVHPVQPTGFEAIIVTSNPAGEIIGRRELRTARADCHALDEPLALVIALTVDPESGFIALPDSIPDTDDADLQALLASAPVPGGEPPAVAPAEAGDDGAPPATPAKTAPPTDEPPAPLPPARLYGPYALGAVASGQAPGVTGAFGAGYAGSRSRLRAGLEARFWLPRNDALGTGRYRTSGAQLTLYGCPLWRQARKGGFEGMLCGGATPGVRVFRDGDGARETRADVELTLLGRLLLHTTRSITPFLGAEVGLVVYGVVLEEDDAGQRSELWRTPVARGGASVGILFAR